MGTFLRLMLSLMTVLGCLWSTGCESSGTRDLVDWQGAPRDAATARLTGLAMRDVEDAARQVFRQHFSIDAGASREDLLVSRPRALGDDAEDTAVNVVLSGGSRDRRLLAKLQLLQQGTDTIVACQVEMQRMDIAERAAFARQRGDDRPTDTPIERMGADSPRGSEHWSPAGRHRKLERRILGEIQAALGQGEVN